MAVTLRVYDSDLTTLLATLDQPYGITWSRERKDTGAGQFTIPHDAPSLHATPGVLRRDNLVTVTVDTQDEFAWIIRRRSRQRGDVWDPIQVTGPGAIEVLRQALVYQYGGLDSQIQSDERLFGWMTFDFPDDNWGPVGSSMTGGPLSTEGFPDEDAVAFEPIFPGGRALYRRRILSSPGEDLAGPARMALAASISTEVVIYLDGEEVMRKDAGEQGLVTVDIDYIERDRQFAVDVQGGTGRWGWTWVQLVPDEDSDDGWRYGSVIRRTYDPDEFPDADSPWLSYERENPDDDYPGVTAGFILGRLFDEYLDRGGLAALSYDFDADEDSAGNPWPRVGEWSGAPGTLEFACQVGDDSILSVIERLRDHGVDAELGADLVLRAWHRRGTYRGVTAGDDGLTPVEFPLDLSRDVGTETDDETINVVLARTKDAWLERPSPAVTSDRREGFLSLGMTPSAVGGARITDDVLDGFNTPAQVVRWTVNSGQEPPEPIVDFDLGDVVVGPWLDPDEIEGEWQEADVRVDTIAAAIDAVGAVDWVLEATPDLGQIT